MFRWSVFAIALTVFMAWVVVQSHRESAAVANLEQQIRNQQAVAGTLTAVRPQVHHYMTLMSQFQDTVRIIERLRRNTAQPEAVLPVLAKEAGAPAPIESVEFAQDTTILYDASQARLEALRPRLVASKDLSCYKVLARAKHPGFRLECKFIAPQQGAR